MPLTRLNDEYLERDGVRFLMKDEDGVAVICWVGHQALRDHADRLHFTGTDGAVFEAYRKLIEDFAVRAFEAFSAKADACSSIANGLQTDAS